MSKMLKYCGVALAIAVPATQASAERLFGLTGDNRIVTFDSSTPGVTTSSGAISGLGGDTLIGLDLRPATRSLYSVSTSGNLYSISKNGSGSGYTASLVGNTGTALTSDGYGLDFNPVPDRLRLITSDDANLRINPGNAATLTDTAINPSTFSIIASAYANNRAGALTTTLYGLDANANQLLRSTNPNGGVYVSVGSLGIDLGALGLVGFDISGATGIGFFNDAAELYTVDLLTGASTSLGTIGVGSLTGLTAASVPEPATWAMMIGGFGLVGAAMRRRWRSTRPFAA